MTQIVVECPKCGEKDKANIMFMAGGCGTKSHIAGYCKACEHRWDV